MSDEFFVQISFWSAFILSILIAFYAYKLIRRIGSNGLLTNVITYTGIFALSFGFHHIFEIFFEHNSLRIIPESLEAIAAILLFMAIWQLYKLS
jgi:hypothetical protein